MNKLRKLITLIGAVAITGCTGLESPDGWKYRNGLFNKQFSELTIEKTTSGTNTTFKASVKGWKSDGAAIAEAVAEGVTKGAAKAIVP